MLAIIFVILVVYALNLPYTPAGPALERRLRRERRELHAARDRAAADLRHLVPGLGQGPLPGSRAHARRGRGHGAPVTLDELRQAAAAGEVDTVLLVIADMEGRLQGKRLTASHFLDEVVEHNAEGCNYLLAVDVDMNTVSGYEMSSWERGYGDFVMKPDFDTLRPIPWHDGTVLADGGPRLGGRRGRGRVAPPDPAPAARPAGRARLEGDGGDGARVHRLQRQLRGRVEEGLPRPRPGEPLQRRLLDARHGPRRAADPPHPQLDDGRGAAGRELEGRVQLRPARDQLPLRRGARHRRRPRDLQERRQGDRGPGGHGDHLHGEARRARGQLLPHPLLAAERRRQRLRRRRGDLQPVRRGPARLPAGADAVLRAARQLVQALRARLVRADGGRLGPGQPDLLDAGGRARPVAARREPAAGRGRQPVPCAGGDDRRRSARDRRAARARAGLRGQRLRLGQAARAAHPVRRARPVRRTRRSRATPSGKRSSTTT